MKRLIFLIALLPGIALAQPSQGSSTKITDGAQTLDITAGSAAKVDGSAVTQPVSASSLPLPSGAATSAKQDTGNASLSSIDGKITAVNTGAVVVSSSALPSGASTAAKQPALGTAGTPSADVITVQGVTSMTALKVDGSAVTQPVSGTLTCNAGSGTLTTDTELSAAATLADNTSNPSATAVGTFAHWFDGSTWDRARGDSTDGLLVNLGSNNDVTVTGTVTAQDGGSSLSVDDNGSSLTVDGTVAATQSGTWNVGTVTTVTDVVHVDDNASTLSVDDGAGSLTVDGTVTAAQATASSLNAEVQGDAAHDAAVSGNPILLGAYAKATAPTDVSADGDAVRLWADLAGRLQVGDGGGSLTIDGSATCNAGTNLNTSALALESGGNLAGAATSLAVIDDWDESDRAKVNPIVGQAGVQGGSGAVSATTQRVVLATDVALPAGTNAIGKLSANSGVDIGDVTIDNATLAVTQSGTWDEVGINDSGNSITIDGTVTASNTAGDVAHDGADSGNPVKVGGKAVNALPTAVANNDRANFITDLWGRQLTASIDPAMQIHKSVNFTTTQTGTDVWSPTSGKKIAVTSVIVSSYDTTGCRLLLWFGDNADTTYSAGTDQLLLPFSTVPSTTIKPGIVYTPAVPVFCTTADRELHVTTDGACDIDIVVEGWEW